MDVNHHEKKRSAWKSVVMFVILFVCLIVRFGTCLFCLKIKQ